MVLGLPQPFLLRDHGIEHDAVGLFNFIKAVIEWRQYSKFVFTRSLSDSMRLMACPLGHVAHILVERVAAEALVRVLPGRTPSL